MRYTHIERNQKEKLLGAGSGEIRIGGNEFKLMFDNISEFHGQKSMWIQSTSGKKVLKIAKINGVNGLTEEEDGVKIRINVLEVYCLR
jgi:hypothetical protein